MLTADCLKFVESLTLTKNFVEKFPLKYAVVRSTKSLNSEIMSMTLEKDTKLFKSLVNSLVQLDQVTPTEVDGICRVQAIS